LNLDGEKRWNWFPEASGIAFIAETSFLIFPLQLVSLAFSSYGETEKQTSGL
jgi:hypothetical protein